MANLAQFSPKAGVSLIVGIIGLITCILGASMAYQTSQYLASHKASLGALQAETKELLTFSPIRLASDDSSFQRFRDINTQFVAQFQQLKYGNDQTGAAALSAGDDPAYASLLSGGDALLEKYGNMIQSRQEINKYRQFSKRLLSEASALVTTTNSNLQTSEQQSLLPAQLKAVMQLSNATNDHHYQVLLAVQNLDTQASDLMSATNSRQSNTQTLIQSLTEGNSRLSNPILRRMYVNLNDQLEQHYDSIRSIQSVVSDYQAIKTTHTQLKSALATFATSIDEVNQALSGGAVLGALLMLIGAVLTGIGFFGAGWLLRGSDKQAQATALTKAERKVDPLEYTTPVNNTKENTQQRKQVITERNQLIHDIQPIMDGVFYVEANEYAETTGDIAKIFNGARRSIVKRIQLIQQEINRLQQLQSAPSSKNDKQPNKTLRKTETSNSPSLSQQADIKACVDITFDTQTKIEQIKRWQSVDGTDTTTEQMTQQLESLMQCQDHLRVRLRDLQQILNDGSSQPTLSDSPAIKEEGGTTPVVTDFERLSRLVNSFQLKEVPRARQRKPQPNPATT
ncbi:hypothetical protein A9Q99_13885 [Gammaproteobacteria bacterium 45_16_T64]|nr:hypothetical protein A9Q99_13885 [Gammaproteobacteria bacterium 45_16_T64]